MSDIGLPKSMSKDDAYIQGIADGEDALKRRPEILFAHALRAIEPEKIEGGSAPRQKWLALVLEIQGYMHENKMDTNLFRDTLIEGD